MTAKSLASPPKEFKRHGAFAEYVSVPRRIVYKLPDSLPQSAAEGLTRSRHVACGLLRLCSNTARTEFGRRAAIERDLPVLRQTDTVFRVIRSAGPTWFSRPQQSPLAARRRTLLSSCRPCRFTLGADLRPRATWPGTDGRHKPWELAGARCNQMSAGVSVLGKSSLLIE